MSDPVRTLFVTHAAELGGAERSLLEILERLDRAAVSPVLCSLAPGPVVDAARAAHVPTHVLAAPDTVLGARRGDLGLSPAAVARAAQRGAASWPVVRAIARLARAERARLVYTNSAKAHVLGGLAGRSARVPVIWHVRDYPAAAPVRAFFSGLARVAADAVVCNSAFTAGPFRGHPGCRVILNGLPGDAVRAARPAADVRADLGLRPEHLVAGTAGRLDHWKGIPTFLDAAALAAARVPQARFVVAGAPLYHHAAYRDELQGRARAAGIADRVIFTGFRADIYDVINAFDVYVHPSEEPEPFGRGIVEAMLLQKPAVAAAHGGPLEIVDPGVTGALFPAGDAAALARAVEELFRNPEQRAAQGAAGRARALERFSATRMLREITDAIQKAAK